MYLYSHHFLTGLAFCLAVASLAQATGHYGSFELTKAPTATASHSFHEHTTIPVSSETITLPPTPTHDLSLRDLDGAANIQSILVYTFLVDNPLLFMHSGDIAILLPTGVPEKVNGVLKKDPKFGNTPECNDGNGDFGSKKLKPGISKRALQFADVICAAESFVGLLFSTSPAEFGVTPTFRMGSYELAGNSEVVAHSIEIVRNYAKSKAVEFKLDQEVIEGIVNLSWALAWIFHQGKSPIHPLNVLPAAGLIRSELCTTTTTQVLGEANCSILGGAILECATKYKTITITTGGACETSTSTDKKTSTKTRTPITTISVTPWTVADSQPTLSPDCPDDSSTLSSDSISGIADGDFCQVANNREKPVTKAYNNLGDDFVPVPLPDGRPPYKVELSWKPFTDGPSKPRCKLDCSQAFVKLKESKCGKQGGNNSMSRTGRLNVGCGEYSYSIIPPPSMGQRTCFDKYRHGDVSAKYLNNALDATVGSRKRMIRPGEKINFDSPKFKTIYKFEISWLPDCISSLDPIWADIPIPDVKAHDLLYDNWKLCDNEGTGGYVDFGCLRYTFRPEDWDHTELKIK